VRRAIEQLGIAFMFAPAFHPAMKYAIGPRKEIGIRTIFNVLGPLTNPASANAHVLGVYDRRLTEPLAETLLNLNYEDAMVVHGLDGLDEISTLGNTVISHLKNGEVTTTEFHPSYLGMKIAHISDLCGGTPRENAEILFKILSGILPIDDPQTEVVLVNSAAAVVVAGKAEDLAEGMEVSRESISSGSAYAKLKGLVKISGGDQSRIEELEEKYE
jgi:anthranilate phosphoribosyltransferase